MKPSELERSLVRQLREANFPQASPPIAVFSASELTLDEMANALAATSCGILVEPESIDTVNKNVPGFYARLSWHVRAVINPISSMSAALHPMDVAVAAMLAVNLRFPRNESGESLTGSQWQCSAARCEHGEFKGNMVRTAVFSVSVPFSIQTTNRN